MVKYDDLKRITEEARQDMGRMPLWKQKRLAGELDYAMGRSFTQEDLKREIVKYNRPLKKVRLFKSFYKVTDEVRARVRALPLDDQISFIKIFNPSIREDALKLRLVEINGGMPEE